MPISTEDVVFFSLLIALICIALLCYSLVLSRKKIKTLESHNAQLELAQHYLDIVDFPIWFRDIDGNITYSNQRYNHITSHDAHTAPSGLFQGAEKIATIAQQKDTPYREQNHIIENGERKLYTITETPTQLDHSIIGTFGYAHDLDQLESLQRSLKQHLSVQSDLLESSRSAIAIFSADKRLRFYNNAFVKFWELDERFLSKEPEYGELLDCLRDTRKLPEQANFQAFKKESLAMFTNLIEKKDDFFYLPDGKMLRQLVIPHEHGGLLISYEDLTEQITQEQTYNTLVNVNKSTLDNLYEGVVVFGQDGRIQLCNPAYISMWHLDKTTLNSSPHLHEIFDNTAHLYDFIDNGDLYKDNLLSAITHRKSLHEKLALSDGKIIDFSCVPLPDGASLMTYIDITDSALVEQSLRAEKKALEEADLIKSRFLSSISYELRSPLTSIRGFSEGLLRGYLAPLSPEQESYIKAIFDSSVNLTNLIDNILDVASIDSGYMTLDITDFDINKMIEKVEYSIQAELKSKQCSFELSCPKNMGTMLGDEKRIKQVLSNLLYNAVRFSQKKDVINFTINTKGTGKNLITFEIESSGKPLSKHDQERVFDRFYKVPTDLSVSSGLGLTLAKSFIELHGGKITIGNKGKDRIRIVCTLKRNNKHLAKISD